MPTFSSACFYCDLVYGPPGGNQFRSRLYYESTGSAPTATGMADLCDQIFSQFSGAMAAVLTDTHEFFGVEGYFTSGTTQFEGASSDTSVPGTAAGSPSPEEVAVCIQRKTGIAGRMNRGRVFISGVPEGFTDPDSTLTDTAVTAYKNLAKKINTPQNVGEVNLVPCTPNFTSNPISLIPVALCYVNREVKSRRDRRQPKRGQIVPQTAA